MTDTQRRALARFLRAHADTCEADARTRYQTQAAHIALKAEADATRAFADAMDVRVCDFRKEETPKDEYSLGFSAYLQGKEYSHNQSAQWRDGWIDSRFNSHLKKNPGE